LLSKFGQYLEKYLEMGVRIIIFIFLHSWTPAVPSEFFTRIAGGVWWNEVGFSSLVILLSQICFPKSTLSTMLREDYPEVEQLSQLDFEYAIEDNSANPSIDKLTSFFSQVS
jgi:hypothetical protein